MKADQLLPAIMVVDDDDDDVALLSRQLSLARVRNPLLHFRTGTDAFLFLKQCCPPVEPPQPLPILMFLDINMQGLSGFDLLGWAREQAALDAMRIYILSGAREEWDAQIAAKLGADDYLEKFPPPAVFAELLQSRDSGARAPRGAPNVFFRD